MRHAKLQLIYHEAKQKGTATKAECEAFVERTVRLAETYPKKMADYLKAAAPYLFTFLRHKDMEGTNNPGREGGASHSGAPEDQRPDRQREGNAEDGHLVHVPAYLAQEEPQRLSRVGARLGAQVDDPFRAETCTQKVCAERALPLFPFRPAPGPRYSP